MLQTNQLPSLEGPGVGSYVRFNLERRSCCVIYLKCYSIIPTELTCARAW